MAWIQKIKGRKRWRVRWREGGRESPELASSWFDSRTAVDAEAQAIEARVAAAKAIKRRAGIDLAELVGRWAAHQRNRARPRTERYIAEGTRTLLALIKSRGWQRTTDVAAADDLPTNTFRLLRALLRFARDRHDQPVAARALVPPDAKRRTRAPRTLLTDERADELVAKASEWGSANGAIAHLVATYGHRPESLVQLRVGALERLAYLPLPKGEEPPRQTAWLTLKVKSGDIHRHPLLPATAELLTAEAGTRADTEPLFVSHLGRTWTDGREFSAWFHHSVGKGTGIYRLKDRAITRLLAAGVDLPTIAAMTGHRDPLILSRYLHSNDARQQQALSALENFARAANVRTTGSHK